jgi:hypothetical protein
MIEAAGEERGAGPSERPLFDVLVNPFSLRGAPVLWLLSFLVPRGGLPVSLCVFHNLTGLPCPGCGLTRSLASISHLCPGEALRYHPFGPLIYALLVALTAASIAGEGRRARLRAWIEGHPRRGARARAVYRGCVAAFLAFGLARLGLALAAQRNWFAGT